MSERLVVDSIMTADGEVVPLGPVDKDGHRVPLDTGELYGEDGKCINVGYFLYFPFTNEWFIEEMLSRSRFGVSMADFKSGHGLTFLGDENWLVCPRDLAHELYDERILPFGVQVYCPDGGGALRLTYDLRMQAAKSLREDSTLCLLWAMLMDSYSRWRTTGDVFSEMGENCGL